MGNHDSPQAPEIPSASPQDLNHAVISTRVAPHVTAPPPPAEAFRNVKFNQFENFLGNN